MFIIATYVAERTHWHGLLEYLMGVFVLHGKIDKMRLALYPSFGNSRFDRDMVESF